MNQITVDFSKITGRIKPMHGVGQPPLLGTSTSMFHYLKEAGIPFSRQLIFINGQKCAK